MVAGVYRCSRSDLSVLKKFSAQALSNGVPGLDIDGDLVCDVCGFDIAPDDTQGADPENDGIDVVKIVVIVLTSLVAVLGGTVTVLIV